MRMTIFGIVGIALLAGCQSEPVKWIEIPLAERTFFDSAKDMHRGHYQVEVAAGESLEYMLQMNRGDTIIYRWTNQADDPKPLVTEFHGHTIRDGDKPGTVMIYKTDSAAESQGSLAAPFDGIHGWYFNNESDNDIVLDIEIVGFYELYEEEH